jgi:hypothetical protein
VDTIETFQQYPLCRGSIAAKNRSARPQSIHHRDVSTTGGYPVYVAMRYMASPALFKSSGNVHLLKFCL